MQTCQLSEFLVDIHLTFNYWLMTRKICSIIVIQKDYTYRAHISELRTLLTEGSCKFLIQICTVRFETAAFPHQETLILVRLNFHRLLLQRARCMIT
jgi:hypothetical protein